MHPRSRACLVLTALCVLAVGARPARPDDPGKKASPEAAVSPHVGPPW
jgi:hypothetical protein